MRNLLFILALIMMPMSIFSQERADPLAPSNGTDTYKHSRYGAWLHYNLNFHRADFLASEIQVQSCCPQFENASGSGVSFGFLYEHPISSNLLLGIRAGFFMKGAELITNEDEVFYDYINDSWQDGVIEHSLDVSINTIALEPMVNFRFWDEIAVHAGFHLDFLNITKEYSHTETLIEPEEGAFENGSRSRLNATADIEDISGIGFGLLGGLSYEIALNENKNMLLAPEIFYHFGLTPVVSDVTWNIDNLRMGLAFKYFPYEKEELPPLSGSITAKGVLPDGSESENVVVKVEEFESTRMRPLLTYIFFSENSAEIPERYNLLSRADADLFSIDNLHGYGVLETYHHILNIIGRRMQEHPEAKIAIEGCNANVGPERNNIALSKNRAQSVRDYLKDIWNISEDRMILSERNLPQEPSNIREDDGIEENRRVEITSNSMDIIAPIITNDTLRIVNPPKVKFYPDVTSENAISYWNVNALQNGETIKSFNGSGKPPQEIEWLFRRSPRAIPTKESMLNYKMELLDVNGQTYETETNSLPVEQITVRQKRRKRVADKYIDEYSLILFEFDESKLSYYNSQVIDFIKSKITPESEVFISGHTDRMGPDEYNKKLSAERAGVAADALPQVKSVTGYGEEELLYNNNLPEGRFYCRRVDIRVETPVEFE